MQMPLRFEVRFVKNALDNLRVHRHSPTKTAASV
jgi:hypothetical protein